jgi:ubiquitin
MARLNQVRLHVKPESQYSNRSLREHHDKASIEETACDAGDEWNDEKSDGECRRNNRNPLCSHEEATDCEEKYPACPFGATPAVMRFMSNRNPSPV